jgi:predicted GIY-YIG superfamily endonuclease
MENSEPTVRTGIVYKIVCNKTDKTYYGSTTQTLAKRKSMHKINNTSSSKEKGLTTLPRADSKPKLVFGESTRKVAGGKKSQG